LFQVGDTTVLSAAPERDPRPKRVLFATNLSAMSGYAIQLAIPFIAADAEIYLINVGPPSDALDGAWDMDSSAMNRETRTNALQRARGLLTRPSLKVNTVSLTGDAAEETLHFASSHDIDLIVAGTHGYGFFHRLVLGSVVSELLLCVPGSAQARASHRVLTSPHCSTMHAGKLF
jgi:nucleotide-binding universal stress UspA family protein